jgi:putative FmdB family regulatory protein
MPTYLYECDHCGEFEDFHSVSKIYTECPKCKEDGREQTGFKQLINCKSKGTVVLSGQDLVNSVKSGAQQLQKDAAKNENLYSNLLGESRYQDMQSRMDKAKKEKY